jgi:hypothetical protein
MAHNSTFKQRRSPGTDSCGIALSLESLRRVPSPRRRDDSDWVFRAMSRDRDSEHID